jgi:DNA-directed RNA polymerase specialized sigma24 family protein
LIKVVNMLGGINKGIFLMKHAFGLPDNSIAAMLRDSTDNVGSRLRRSHRKLNALLMKGDNGDIE